MMTLNVLAAIIAYSAIVAVIVIIARGGLDNDCNQDCNQGRDCSCDDEWNVK